MKKIFFILCTLSLLGLLLMGCSNQNSKEEEKQSASQEKETVPTTKDSEPTKEVKTPEKETPAFPRVISDAAGHEIELAKAPERIALLHTFYMEHFLALDAPPVASAIGNSKGQMEALSESELFSPYLKGREIQNLGSAREINLEAILSAEPDAIVTFAKQGGVDKAYDQLSQIAPVILLDYTLPWQDQLRRCSEILGKEALAEKVIQEIETDIKTTKEVLSGYPERTFALFRTDGKAFINRATPQYFETFGLTAPQGYPEKFDPLSLEAVAEMNPHYIVFQHNRQAAEGFVKSLETSSIWQSLDAVKNQHIYYFDENMNTFGPLAHQLTAKKLLEIYQSEK